MEKRKRVSYIMNSDAFRAELENIIDYQLSHGPHPASVMALQHLADMLLPTNGAGPSTSTLSKGMQQPFSMFPLRSLSMQQPFSMFPGVYPTIIPKW